MAIQKIKELSGNPLNYAVAKAEGYEARCAWLLDQQGYVAWQSYERGWGNPIPNYCETHAGDEIIDRELISTQVFDNSFPIGSRWNAYLPGHIPYKADEEINGATRREAAMRAWAVYKLGETIDIPEGCR